LPADRHFGERHLADNRAAVLRHQRDGRRAAIPQCVHDELLAAAGDGQRFERGDDEFVHRIEIGGGLIADDDPGRRSHLCSRYRRR
jgi:hypothetical protein